MAKRNILANLGEWFDKGEGKKLDGLLGKWLKDHAADRCDTSAWLFVLMSQFRDELECSLGCPDAWLRCLDVDGETFGGKDDPRLKLPEMEAEQIFDGLRDWVTSDYHTDILSMNFGDSRGEFLTALFWCTGYDGANWDTVDFGV